MAEKLKAEIWDKMQYMFRNYYDRMVHAALYYDGRIDIPMLKTVIICMAEKVPVLHSAFHPSPIDPYWTVEMFTVDDIFTEKVTTDLEADLDAFITQCIPIDSNVQFKIAVFHDGERDVLSMIVNHMCFDGGDFKYFLKKLCENYNSYRAGGSPLNIKTGSRSYDQVYTKLSPEEEKVAKGLYKNISAVKDAHYFPLTPDSPEDKSHICRRKVAADKFEAFRLAGKKFDVTVNDLMLAVYMRALFQILDAPETDNITIPCMVDLRRHIEGGGEQGGLTNHTGFMQCSITGKGETINDTLIRVIESVKKSKRDKYMGLYSLPLLKLAYAVFPYLIAETAIKIGYLNPLIGMSNIGPLPVDLLRMGDAKVVDGFMTGAVKYKPYMQLALTSMYGELTMTIAIRGNARDYEVAEKFFDLVEGNIEEFIQINTEEKA